MRYKLGQIGLVLGTVLLIMGIALSNAMMWGPGAVLLGLGVLSYRQRDHEDSDAKHQRYIDAMQEVIEAQEDEDE